MTQALAPTAPRAERAPAGPGPVPDRQALDLSGGRAARPGLLMLLALAFFAALALRHFIPPSVVPATAPPAGFSAERALPHLQAIAQRPHPVGSPENARARDYLIQQLSAMGLQPEVQRTAVLRPEDGEAATVENVLVRLTGTAPTRAVLVTAHYDAVVSGPGVGDNGVSVAALLETLRALRAGPSLRNDVIFLFNDGEEAGLFGATAFVAEHPWAQEVGVVFDFDADGPTGPTILLWTSPHDGWLVRELARAAPGVVAASAENDAQRRDDDNDLNVFAAAGLAGAHFDVVGGSTAALPHFVG